MGTHTIPSSFSFRSLSRAARALPIALVAGAVACGGAPADESTGSTSSAYSSAQVFAYGVSSFKAINSTTVLYTDSSGDLFEQIGNASPTLIDSNVLRYASLDGDEIYVLDDNHVLWRELGTAAQSKTRVDGNVQSFQPWEFSFVYVQGMNNNLWLENGSYETRQFIDANVSFFQATDVNDVYVVGTDQNLWHEVAPYGNGPQGYTSRSPIDGSVAQFQAVPGAARSTVWVVGTDGNFWNETEDGSHTPSSYRYQVDSSVLGFAAVGQNTVFVEGGQGRIWQEASDNSHGVFVDEGSQTDRLMGFQPISDSQIFVLKGGTLQLESVAPAPVSYRMPTGGLLNSSGAVWIQPDGSYLLSGYVQCSVDEDYSVAIGIQGSRGTLYTFEKDGTGCSGGTPFTKSGTNATLRANYPYIKAGYTGGFDVQSEVDWPAVLNQLEQLFHAIQAVVNVVSGT